MPSVQMMEAELPRAFEAAQQLSKTREEFKGMATQKKLRLYALFKQATCGDAPTEAPSQFAPVDRLKWNAWSLLAGDAAERAMREYVALVQSVVSSEHAEEHALDGEDDPAALVEDELMSRIGGHVFSMPERAEAEEPSEWQRSGEGSAFEVVKAGRLEHALELLDKSARQLLGARDEDGRTLLHWASDLGFAPIVRALLERGAQVDARDAEGLTPLHMAAMCEHELVVALLLLAGADAALRDADGLPALELASAGFSAKLELALAEERARRSATPARPASSARQQHASRAACSAANPWLVGAVVCLVAVAVGGARHLGLLLSPAVRFEQQLSEQLHADREGNSFVAPAGLNP